MGHQAAVRDSAVICPGVGPFLGQPLPCCLSCVLAHGKAPEVCTVEVVPIILFTELSLT